MLKVLLLKEQSENVRFHSRAVLVKSGMAYSMMDQIL